MIKANLPYHIYKLSNRLYKARIPLLPMLLQQLLRFGFCCFIPYQTQIGENVHFGHNGMGIVLDRRVVIGRNVRIDQHVTIGGRKDDQMPVIENNVRIGAGAKILGGVKVGDGAQIGANAVVIKDVPPGATAVGVPAKNILKKEISESGNLDLLV